MNDPIVDEIRRIRDEHAARFGYDLDAIYADIKEQEKKSGRQFVSLASKEGRKALPKAVAGSAARALTKVKRKTKNKGK